jgi:metal-dependent amidase/aminoacylase/carboxypeptidase family protein
MMDEQERPEANEVEMDEQERREVNEADKLYAQAGELYENTVSASRQAGATRREEAEQRRAAEEEAEQQANEVAKQFADAVRASYQVVADRSVSAQALNAQMTQQFFNSVINNLRSQAESNRQMTEELQGQQQRSHEATRTIAQESVGAYMEFLHSIFSFAPGKVQGWDESKHARNFEGRFEGGEAWEESEHQRDAGGRFT